MKRSAGDVVLLLIIACAVTGGLWALQTHFERQDEELARQVAEGRLTASREGCRRANKGVRRPLYEFLRNAEQARYASAAASGNEEQRKVDLKAARQYGRGAQQMVNAAVPFQQHPGSPMIDCELAYPFVAAPGEGG